MADSLSDECGIHRRRCTWGLLLSAALFPGLSAQTADKSQDVSKD